MTLCVEGGDEVSSTKEATGLLEHKGFMDGWAVTVAEDLEEDAFVTIHVHGKSKQVCRTALIFLGVASPLRSAVLAVVEWKWFERFILLCIVVNSILLGIYQHRAEPGFWLNEFIDNIADLVLWIIFTVEMVLKILSYGLICQKRTYLRDPWNFLDFVVVMSGFVERLGAGSSLSFLRLFRLLRPLRSLNAVPQMKVLVNTTLSSVLKLGNVIVLGIFLFTVFAIIGVQLMGGIFYRRCHVDQNPTLIVNTTNPELNCWSWTFADDDRLCGGNYMCEDSESHCGGHTFDPETVFRPNFEGGMRDFPWCADSVPSKLKAETEFVHFDHLPAALLLIFQSMTLEGWTDLMYMVEDAYNPVFAVIFFLLVVIFTNFFMLNVALAVVDEVQDEFRSEAAEAEAEKEGSVAAPICEDDSALWYDCTLVRWCMFVFQSELFANFIMVIIFGNVVNMCISYFSLTGMFGKSILLDTIEVLELVFLGIFVFEMIISIIALGPKMYCLNPITAFDGFVVVISIIEVIANKTSPSGGGGSLSALRTFRLFRVMNKIANKWIKLKVLLKAMLRTGMALNYWLILFVLLLYICTLMWMFFFAKQFHFVDFEDPAELTPKMDSGNEWCPEPHTGRSYHFKEWCIPRAHFDTFIWGFIAVFQVMTGENWNVIMYSGMRASERWENTLIPPTILSAGVFVVLILFGQTLFLSLFLSMLISKFDEVSGEIEEQEVQKKRRADFAKSRSERQSTASIDRAISQWTLRMKRSRDAAESPETLPGQLPDPALVEQVGSDVPGSCQFKDEDDVDGHEVSELISLMEMKAWPRGYAFCLLSEFNPIRKAAIFLLKKEVQIKGTRIPILDNFILACILISTICMMIDTPLSDPEETLTQVIRTMDKVFAIIFMIEMAIKLVALGLIREPGAYLRSKWNWLDGVVVLVSIIDFASGGGGPGFLRVLRILRTFRPLRVISRNDGLKVVVQTLFASMGDLFALVIASSLFWLIFALIFLMALQGKLFYCDGPENIGFLGPKHSDLPSDFATPLCLGASITAGDVGSKPRGHYDMVSAHWVNGTCDGDMPLAWSRATADTPICVARCDPTLESHPGIEALCHRKYAKPEELPSTCKAADPLFAKDEAIGLQYVADMQRSLTVPCGGFTVVDKKVVEVASGVSCVKNFCPKVKGVSSSCEKECKAHPYFCVDTCRNDKGSTKCEACRRECESACMCPEFCTPLSKDAGLCHEQGGSWVQRLSQNFDNIINSLLTLFEISTTEGWVDVMYAASDHVGPYMQPVRDAHHVLYVLLFPLWILLSFMFLINLAVGVIVEKFNSIRNENMGKGVLLTDAQQKWIDSRMALHGRAFFYDLTMLHLLHPNRRKVYDFVSSRPFDQFIMGTIVCNTVLMALAIFPEPTPWWSRVQVDLGYVLASVYVVEAALKLFALRMNYWKDSWNCFDFFCVVATLVGLLLLLVFKIDLGPIASVIRILRVARLFRLLRFLKDLNRLFMCLFISIPKLLNVTAILLLFLILFSILGMSVFGTAKFIDDGTLDVHGNFQTFFRGFVTLFRASTGEAWNEIMHSLAHDETSFFRSGSWCAPQSLFKTRDDDVYAVLKNKCLIDPPHACPGDWNPMPAFFWIAYTLLISWMIMNLVIAVILLGYEEGREQFEKDVIELCIEVWKKYDPDQTLSLPLDEAVKFVWEVSGMYADRAAAEGKDSPCSGRPLPLVRASTTTDLSKTMPMIVAKTMEMTVDDNNRVAFTSATRQVLRFLILEDFNDGTVRSLDHVSLEMGKKERAKLDRLEQRPLNPECPAHNRGSPLAVIIAASKLQRTFRRLQKRKQAQKVEAKQVKASASKEKDDVELFSDQGLRSTSETDAVTEPSSPPPAG
eukprot:TRINITY_DN9275_c0_g4_i1.p1 TRINITY_DN9275_c0_g4~~TRINITY_DN9275_c0_g4_i1.p1  ORF type:complete len:1865 (-),score=301.26 TRINITY_DN9275_c0_g4_i1:204-5798(-)